MKICTIFGDMSSDKSSENYPTDLFCDECFNEMAPNQEESGIVNYQDDDGSYGDSCSKCGKTKKEETNENS